MRFTASDGLRTIRHGFALLALLGLSASGASAQIVFDGNLFFNNNASGTLAGQLVGSNGAGAPACGAAGALIVWAIVALWGCV